MEWNFSGILIKGLKMNGWSCSQLAQKTDLTERAVQYYAKGERVPSVYNADKILAALGISLTIGKRGGELNGTGHTDQQQADQPGDSDL